MAEGQEQRDAEDLSEEASQYRLDEMREKGQVAQSRELTGLLALIAAFVALYAFMPSMSGDIAQYMREIFQVDQAAKMDLGDHARLGAVLLKALKLIGVLVAPVAIAGFLVGVVGSYAQIGSVFSVEPLQPSLDKINPLKGAQRFLSMKHFIESLRMLLKAGVAMFVAYGIVKSQVIDSPGLIFSEPQVLLMNMGASAKQVFFSLMGVFLVFSVIDFALQKYDYKKQARLTKQEAKQEHKEREGDPQIKARIRSVQREMARKRMMAAIKTADVIVTNPTHIAIAIKYDKDTMMAPKVVAKGADLIAQKIKAIAAEAGIPLVENVPLARTLFKVVKINQGIPRALFQAVAEVLAYVYRLKNRTL